MLNQQRNDDVFLINATPSSQFEQSLLRRYPISLLIRLRFQI